MKAAGPVFAMCQYEAELASHRWGLDTRGHLPVVAPPPALAGTPTKGDDAMRRPTMTAAASFVTVLLGTACTFALLIAASASLGGDKKETKLKEPTAAQKKIAKAIAAGHAYEKHVIEEKLFPEVKSASDFRELIGKVLANPTHQRGLE